MHTPNCQQTALPSLWRYRQLILTLTRREVLGRYRGSAGGLLWSLITPLLMLAIYTAVFSGIFKARWGQGDSGSPMDYALQLFAGLIIHALVAECLSRAPGLMISNTSYVKRVVFPLETLAIVNILSALFHALMSIVILILFYLAIHHHLHATLLWLPVVLLPYLIFLAGVSWLLSGLGVYLRDIAQMMNLLTTILLFLSPVFYPASILPARLQIVFQLNPLTLIIEQTRAVVIAGTAPDLAALAVYTVFAALVAALGYSAFQRMKKGFADVL